MKSWITFLNSRLERVNKKLLTSASSLYLISLKSIFFVLDCRYYKSLIKHVYQLPPPPALLIIVFVSRLFCAVRWTQIFFVYLSTKFLTIADRVKTLLRSKSYLLFPPNEFQSSKFIIFSSLFCSVIRLTQDFHLQSALISTPACYLFHKFSKVCSHYNLTSYL